jgi:hypothetical protein
MAVRLLFDLRAKTGQQKSKADKIEESFREGSDRMRKALAAGEMQTPVIRTIRFSLTQYVYEFYGERFFFNTATLFALALAVGIRGGTYGVGGGLSLLPS